jgi:hypothetical protein
LIPPAEGGNSPPFNTDYISEMRVLAKLSLSYSRLVGVNIDDFYSGTNKKTFTPAYTCKLFDAKQAINPKLQFAPTIYDLDRQFAQRYGGCIDGVWFWWVNLDQVGGLQSALENSRLAVQGRFSIYGGVYAHGSSWHPADPTPATLRRTLQVTCRYANGAVVWRMHLADSSNALLTVARSFAMGGASELAGRCGSFVDERGSLRAK